MFCDAGNAGSQARREARSCTVAVGRLTFAEKSPEQSEGAFLIRVNAMSMRATVAGCILSFCAAVAIAQGPVARDVHPTEDEISTIEQRCVVTGGHAKDLTGKISEVIANWEKATAAAEPALVREQLKGIFEPMRSGAALSPQQSLFVGCVEKSLRNFVDTQLGKPVPVSASGSSQSLQRASFASETEIWHVGCEQARLDAVSRLQAECGKGEFVTLVMECPQLEGNVRVYSAHVDGECHPPSLAPPTKKPLLPGAAHRSD